MTRISGYLTCHDAIADGLPLHACLEGLARFCDEVIVVDTGSEDGTVELLAELADRRAWLRVDRIAVDRDLARWAVVETFDVAAHARSLCTGEFCWQAAPHEVPADAAADQIRPLVEHWPAGIDAIAVPRLMYWDFVDTVRIDVEPAVVRLSRNAPHLTHDVVRRKRRFDDDGQLYVAGPPARHEIANLVDARSQEAATASSLIPEDVLLQRVRALEPGTRGLLARLHYQVALNTLVEDTVAILDLSSTSLARRLEEHRRIGARRIASLHNTPEAESRSGAHWSDLDDDALAAELRRLRSSPPPVVRTGMLTPNQLEDWLVAQSASLEAAGV